MEDTGRIRAALMPAARRIVFSSLNEQGKAILGEASKVDRAHILMLTERGIVQPGKAVSLLNAIDELEEQRFRPLMNREAMRGWYFLYEDYLIERLGVETGGILQTGRSRNDWNATILKLRLRVPYLTLTGEILRLLAVLLRLARRYSTCVMPVYTHGQVACPVSLGHYYAGVASALLRDVDGIQKASASLGQCPLGAGAVAGSSIPIDTERTAKLLGFEGGPLHSIDAVASRDSVLHLLAAATVCGVTFSRVATDLMQWLSAEFGFLCLEDDLVGSSSAMPQKRNPFLLEHIQGRTASGLGAFVTAATAMHNAPFTNSIAVGTEAVQPVWQALQDTADMAILLRLVISGAKPIAPAMLRRAVDGFSNATEIANRVMYETGTDFRTAHRIVGRAITMTTEATQQDRGQALFSMLETQGVHISAEKLDPASVAAGCEYGGGPGPRSLNHCLGELSGEWLARVRFRRRQLNRWNQAERILEKAVMCLRDSTNSMQSESWIQAT